MMLLLEVCLIVQQVGQNILKDGVDLPLFILTSFLKALNRISLFGK